MNNFYVIVDGQVVFEGTRRQCKLFCRQNKLNFNQVKRTAPAEETAPVFVSEPEDHGMVESDESENSGGGSFFSSNFGSA